MVALVVVMFDELLDLVLEIARQEVVFQQNAVFQGLVTALNLALRLGWNGTPRKPETRGVVSSTAGSTKSPTNAPFKSQITVWPVAQEPNHSHRPETSG